MAHRTQWHIFQIYAFDIGPLARAVADQIRKVPKRLVALLLDLECLLASLAQLLDRAVEVKNDVVLGCVQHFADRAGDAVCVVVGVLYGGELGRDLVGDAMR